MKIITAGSAYMDIDAYGGVIAYAELLNTQGEEAIAVSTAPLNESITQTIRNWGDLLIRSYQSDPSDTYTLVDVSEPRFFDSFVDIDRVEKVIDHHTGFEDYWKNKIGDNAQIEFVGAACTQVYEDWRRAGLLNRMTSVSAKLLASGILDNTLNFNAEITTTRDREAYTDLAKIGDIDEEWPHEYFEECQQAILADLQAAIRNDIKMKKLYGEDDINIGQVVVWDAKPILDSIDTIYEVMNSEELAWFMNIVSISDGKSYIISDNTELQKHLKETMGIDFSNSIGEANRLWLRKEIIKAAQEQ